VATVATVGVLHTLVPDHWAPIVVIGRQQGWSVARTGRAAAIAGFGHVTSTLILGLVVWAAGVALAVRYGHVVNVVAALALIGFGAWIAYEGWRESQEIDSDAAEGHAHLHRHEDGLTHVHWHLHSRDDRHPEEGGVAVLHEHSHTVPGRTALLLIVGSSPMIEGIPAFFAASTYGPQLLGIMALVFAVATIVTYVTVSTVAIAGLQRASLGPLERYGEVLSGVFVALVGIYSLVTG
jgi:ABC-type nickel/cobalt efflux system permease component RcnA